MPIDFANELRKVLGTAEYQVTQNITRFPEKHDILLSFAGRLKNLNERLGANYVVEFVTEVKVGHLPIQGAFLQIRRRDAKSQGQLVGFLEMRFGWPIVIRTVQGFQGNGPKEFLAETKSHFDIALVDQLIKQVGFVFPKRAHSKEPMVLISQECLSSLLLHNLPMFKRLTLRYLPRESANRAWIHKRGLVPERTRRYLANEIYGRSRHAQQEQESGWEGQAYRIKGKYFTNAAKNRRI